MAESRKGSRIALTPARRMVVELLHHARKVPTLPLGQTLNIAAVAAARKQACPAPSWSAVFMKAYGLVARCQPTLRQAFIRWPYSHIYEHPISECAVLVERDWHGEAIVLGAKIRAPEHMTIAEIDGHLRRFRETPIMEIGYYRQALRIGALPAVLRRFIFWHALELSGYKRAKHFGTFMLSSLGTLGVEQIHPLTPLTTYFTFGPIDPAGTVTLKIVYDHRVMDGRVVGRCLNDLNHVLHGAILSELTGLQRAAA